MLTVQFLLNLYKKLKEKAPHTFKKLMFAYGVLLMGLISFLLLPLLYRYLVVSFLEYKNLSYIGVVVVLYTLCWLACQIHEQIQEILLIKPVEQTISIFLEQFFIKKLYNDTPINYSISTTTADDINALTLFREAWGNFVFGIFLHLIPLVFQLIISILILYLFCGIIYAYSFFLIFILFGCISIGFTKKFICNHQKAIFSTSHLYQFISDRLYNIDLLKIFTKPSEERERLNNHLHLSFLSHVDSRISLEKIRLYQSIILGFGLFIILLISSYHVIFKASGGDHFILVNSYIIQIITPLSALGFIFSDINQGILALKRCQGKIIDLNPVNPQILSPIIFQPIKKISMQNIQYHYPNSKNILFKKGINLSLDQGERIAIIGKTGSGKSTLGKIIVGLLEPKDGNIFINNKKIKKILFSEYSSQISYVSQSCQLLNDTILNNIKLSSPAATDLEIKQAIESACLQEVIECLPNGIYTHVGEFGHLLSGGEKQRITIARAILRKFSLIVFDEITSHLDPCTAKNLVDNLLLIQPQSIKIFITHNLDYFPSMSYTYELRESKLCRI